jgi:hypothetical protein
MRDGISAAQIIGRMAAGTPKIDGVIRGHISPERRCLSLKGV